MAAQTLANYDAALKRIYEGKFREVLNSGTWVFTQFSRSPRRYEGSMVTYPWNVQRNAATGARADGGTLMSAGSQKHVAAQITAKYMYLRGELTGPTMALSRTNSGAFAAGLASEMKFGARDMRKEMNFIFWGDGTGVRATVDASSGPDPTVEVKSAGQATPDVSAPGTRYLREGMDILIGTAAEIAAGTAEVANVSTITDHDTFECAASETVVVSDLIVEGDGSGNSYNNVPMGLVGIVDDDTGTFQAVSRSTYPIIQGTILGNAGTLRVISDDLIQRGFDKVGRRCNGVIDTLVCDPSLRRQILDTVVGDRRYADPKFDKGFQYISYSGGDGEVRLYVDNDCPFNKLFGFDSGSIQLYVNEDFHFADVDGHVLRMVANKDSWEYLMRWYGNLGSDNPAANFVIEDLTISAIDLT